MRRAIILTLLVLSTAVFAEPASATVSATADGTVVLVLTDGLTWEEIEQEPGLREAFRGGAVANLSTAQGAAPTDPRMAYALLGAGARADTSLLPEGLPRDPTEIPGAFTGPVSDLRPGALGDALSAAGVRSAAVGDRAALVVMDGEGRLPSTYEAEDPADGLGRALADRAGFVAVEAGGPAEAGRVAETAREAGATVAVAAPNASAGAANLTPFALSEPETSGGALYSPSTRTEGLIVSSDVTPTVLREFGLQPAEIPPGIQGRAATVRSGTVDGVERLGARNAFTVEHRFGVWAVAGAATLAVFVAGGLLGGRRGLRAVLPLLAALPAGALLAGAVPLTNVAAVVATILLLAGALVVLSRRLFGLFPGVLVGVCLVTAALVVSDAAAGGALMRFSVLGYAPAYGARFYGVGNEYAAILAGSLTVGLGALAGRWRLPLVPVAAPGALAVLILGLPTMGADVGGSLALGFGLGATLGLLRGCGWLTSALWAAGGLTFGAVLFLLGGLLLPDVSHGSRAVGGDLALVEVAARRLLLSLNLLLNPALLAIFAALSVLVYAGWRRARVPYPYLAAGILGGSVTALAVGGLNDSGIVAAVYALAYPAIAALGVLLTTKNPPRVR